MVGKQQYPQQKEQGHPEQETKKRCEPRAAIVPRLTLSPL